MLCHFERSGIAREAGSPAEPRNLLGSASNSRFLDCVPSSASRLTVLRSE